MTGWVEIEWGYITDYVCILNTLIHFLWIYILFISRYLHVYIICIYIYLSLCYIYLCIHIFLDIYIYIYRAYSMHIYLYSLHVIHIITCNNIRIYNIHVYTHTHTNTIFTLWRFNGASVFQQGITGLPPWPLFYLSQTWRLSCHGGGHVEATRIGCIWIHWGHGGKLGWQWREISDKKLSQTFPRLHLFKPYFTYFSSTLHEVTVSKKGL